MDRSEIRKAGKLLAKAESTDSNEEARALAMRAYRLIAAVLNADEQNEPGDGTRRRERRLIRDRRSSRRSSNEAAAPATANPDERAESAYVRFADGTAPERKFDLPL